MTSGLSGPCEHPDLESVVLKINQEGLLDNRPMLDDPGQSRTVQSHGKNGHFRPKQSPHQKVSDSLVPGICWDGRGGSNENSFDIPVMDGDRRYTLEGNLTGSPPVYSLKRVCIKIFTYAQFTFFFL